MSLSRHLVRFRTDRKRIEGVLLGAFSIRISEPERFRALAEWIVIALHDSWSRSCRDIVLDSARGSLSRTGRSLPRSNLLRGYAGCSDPVTVLRTLWATTGKAMPNTWEPDWFVPRNALRAAKLLGVANEIELGNGFGASAAPDHLRITRNVVAHSLPNTWQRFRVMQLSLGLFVATRPAELIVTFDVQSGMRFIDKWLQELEASLNVAIE
jgi:hypothetical protein